MTERSDTGSEALVAGTAEALGASALAGVAEATAKAREDDSKAIRDRRFTIVTDPARDELLTDFGKETLDDRYLLPNEAYQDLFARVADAYADD
ncbi:MAG: ribonucleotide-diphosphate reductase subunit alpha, partial [Novosphingobium sp.]|nr:ribonucleotide-diphosphate reductase subunit alpha [Novosphingobium sp.]